MDAAERVAAGICLAVEEFDFYCDYATAARRIDLCWFVMEQGTNAALRAGWEGKVGGQARVRTQVTGYLTKDIAEDWEVDPREYQVVVEGEPGVDLHMHFTYPTPEPGGAAWDQNSITAFATINAIEQIVDARPGVLTLGEIVLPLAPVGEWEQTDRNSGAVKSTPCPV